MNATAIVSIITTTNNNNKRAYSYSRTRTHTHVALDTDTTIANYDKFSSITENRQSPWRHFFITGGNQGCRFDKVTNNHDKVASNLPENKDFKIDIDKTLIRH